MNNFKKIITTLVLIGVFALTGLALAKDKIDVEYLSGKNLNSNALFNIKGIAPGWSQSKAVRIENDSQDEVNLYINFDIQDGRTLGEVLKLYVIQEDNGHYRIGGESDRFDLKKAHEKGALFIDRLSVGKGKNYRIKLVFDEDAGNEYQGLLTEFDIDFVIESEVANETTEMEILASQGRVVSEEVSIEEAVGVEGDASETVTIVGQATTQEDSGENNRWEFPRWLWLLLLLLLLLIYYLWRKYKKYREKNKNKLK